MNIETAYKPGDKAWAIINGRATRITLNSLQVDVLASGEVIIHYYGDFGHLFEYELKKTKKLLMQTNKL